MRTTSRTIAKEKERQARFEERYAKYSANTKNQSDIWYNMVHDLFANDHAFMMHCINIFEIHPSYKDMKIMLTTLAGLGDFNTIFESLLEAQNKNFVNASAEVKEAGNQRYFSLLRKVYLLKAEIISIFLNSDRATKIYFEIHRALDHSSDSIHEQKAIIGKIIIGHYEHATRLSIESKHPQAARHQLDDLSCMRKIARHFPNNVTLKELTNLQQSIVPLVWQDVNIITCYLMNEKLLDAIASRDSITAHKIFEFLNEKFTSMLICDNALNALITSTLGLTSAMLRWSDKSLEYLESTIYWLQLIKEEDKENFDVIIGANNTYLPDIMKALCHQAEQNKKLYTEKSSAIRKEKIATKKSLDFQISLEEIARYQVKITRLQCSFKSLLLSHLAEALIDQSINSVQYNAYHDELRFLNAFYENNKTFQSKLEVHQKTIEEAELYFAADALIERDLSLPDKFQQELETKEISLQAKQTVKLTKKVNAIEQRRRHRNEKLFKEKQQKLRAEKVMAEHAINIENEPKPRKVESLYHDANEQVAANQIELAVDLYQQLLLLSESEMQHEYKAYALIGLTNCYLLCAKSDLEKPGGESINWFEKANQACQQARAALDIYAATSPDKDHVAELKISIEMDYQDIKEQLQSLTKLCRAMENKLRRQYTYQCEERDRVRAELGPERWLKPRASVSHFTLNRKFTQAALESAEIRTEDSCRALNSVLGKK